MRHRSISTPGFLGSILLATLLATVLLGTSRAQSCSYIPDSSSALGNCFVIPFGNRQPTSSTWANQRYQTLVAKTLLPSRSIRIQELGFAACETGERQCKTIKIRMTHYAAPRLSSAFANNLGTRSVTVLETRSYYWTPTGNRWSRIGLQKPFLFDPKLGNLLVDILVTGAGAPTVAGTAGFRAVTSLPRLYAAGWISSPPSTGTLSSGSGLRMELCFDLALGDTYGRGCSGTNGIPTLHYSGAPGLGSTVQLHLERAALSASASVLDLGADSTAPYPLDLALAGAPGCMAYHDILLSLPFPISKGSGTFLLPIPLDSRLLGA
ncbi:MAG: hypothetical protein ACE5F1_10235, partial [Planctomycetota bacterium]